MLMTILVAIVPSSGGGRIAMTESMNCDLIGLSEWCDHWGMELDEGKSKTMIVSRTPTIHLQSHH